MRADPTSSTRWKHMWGITKEASCGIRRYPRWVGEERGGDGMGGMREESGTTKGKEGFFANTLLEIVKLLVAHLRKKTKNEEKGGGTKKTDAGRRGREREGINWVHATSRSGLGHCCKTGSAQKQLWQWWEKGRTHPTD